MSRRFLCALAIAGILLGLALCALRDDAVSSRALGDASIESADGGADAPGTGARAPDRAEALVRDRATLSESAPPTLRSTPDAEAPPKLAALRGRCIAAESGLPIAGCEVLLNGSPPSTERAQRAGNTETHVQRASTDAEGRFELAYDATREMDPILVIRAEGRCAIGGRSEALAPGGIRDYGDVKLTAAHRVRGRVIDDSGRGVEQVELYVQSQADTIPGCHAVSGGEHATSAAEGRFEFRGSLPAGEWELYPTGAHGLELLSPQKLVVPPPSTEIEVRIARRPSIRGHALDAEGLPIERVALRTDPCAGGHPAYATTDAEGRFALFDPCRRCTATRIHVDPGACEPTVIEPAIAWGTQDLELALRRGLAFRLEVVEAASGAPIERYAIKLFRPGEEASRQRWRNGGAHPDGVLRVKRVARGEYLVIVAAESSRHRISEPLPLWIQDGEELVLRVALQPAACMRVQVRDTNGTPVIGARVELIVPAERFAFSAFQGLSQRAPDRGRGHSNMGHLVDLAETAADGSAELCQEPIEAGFALRVTKRGFAAVVRNNVRLEPGSAAQEFLLREGATLRGRVEPASFAQLDVRVQLTASESAYERNALSWEHDAIPVRPEGTFLLEHAPSGRYTVWLQTQKFALEEPFGTVEIPESGAVDLELDATRFAPALVRGSVELGGRVPAGRQLAFYRLDIQQPSFLSNEALDARGAFAERAILPGRYRLLLFEQARPPHGERRNLDVPEELHLLPGEQRELRVVLPHRRLRLRFADPAGASLPKGTAVRGRTLEGVDEFGGELDADGALVLDPAPAMPFALHVGSQRVPAAGALDLPAVYDSLERTIVVGK